jgi:DNA-binding SARP family transcriptional activator
MSILTIQLFGDSLAAIGPNGDAIPISGRRVEALTAALALKSRGAAHDELAALLFENGGAVAQVRGLVAELRAQLGVLPSPVIIQDEEHVSFDRDLVTIDVRAFDELLGAPSVNSIRKASELYRANLLERFSSGVNAFDLWLAGRRDLYRKAALIVLGNLLTAQIRAGWWEEAVETAGRLLSLDPAQEVVHRTLMRLQLEQGRPDAALRRYEECKDLLERDYAREPDEETQRLHSEIMRALKRRPAPREMTLHRADRPSLVLVVEDDMVSSALVEGYLADEGFEVIAVADGGDALIELGRRHFDLIILDINVPTLSGLKVFEIMIQKDIETPALFITGSAGTDVETRSLEMGAAGFLRKPIRKEVLMPKIRGILQRNQQDELTG